MTGDKIDAHTNNLIAQKDATDIQLNVVRSIKDMYSGNGIKNANFSKDVIFRDPLTILKGVDEVKDAFRASKAFSPKIINGPILLSGRTDKEILVQLRYKCFKPFAISSMCIVEVDEDGNIKSFEELWNFVPLIDYSMCTWSKRLNGWMGFKMNLILDFIFK
jgi:hypothetical protein